MTVQKKWFITTATLAQIKALTPNSYFSLPCTRMGEKKPALLRKVHDEAVKLIKSQPLNMCSILYDKMGSTHKAFLLQTVFPQLS